MKAILKHTVKQDLKDLRAILQITQEEAAFILGVTVTTLSRWMNNRTAEPDPAYQEKLQTLLTLLTEAKEAIKSEGLSWWFKTPHPYLSDLRPLDLLRTASGVTKVRALLGSMRWGLAA